MALFARGAVFFSFALVCFPTPQWSRQFNVRAFFGRIGLPPAMVGHSISEYGAGAGPIVTQLGPVCAQTYAMSTRGQIYGKQNCSRQVMTGWTVADKLWQTGLLQTSYGRQI